MSTQTILPSNIVKLEPLRPINISHSTVTIEVEVHSDRTAPSMTMLLSEDVVHSWKFGPRECLSTKLEVLLCNGLKRAN